MSKWLSHNSWECSSCRFLCSSCGWFDFLLFVFYFGNLFVQNKFLTNFLHCPIPISFAKALILHLVSLRQHNFVKHWHDASSDSKMIEASCWWLIHSWVAQELDLSLLKAVEELPCLIHTLAPGNNNLTLDYLCCIIFINLKTFYTLVPTYISLYLIKRNTVEILLSLPWAVSIQIKIENWTGFWKAIWKNCWKQAKSLFFSNFQY